MFKHDIFVPMVTVLFLIDMILLAVSLHCFDVISHWLANICVFFWFYKDESRPTCKVPAHLPCFIRALRVKPWEQLGTAGNSWLFDRAHLFACMNLKKYFNLTVNFQTDGFYWYISWSLDVSGLPNGRCLWRRDTGPHILCISNLPSDSGSLFFHIKCKMYFDLKRGL